MATSKKNCKDVIIKNELGLHARSAAQIASIVQNAKAAVWIKRGEEKVDASSIMDILTLACEKGTRISIIVDNPSDIDILNAVVELVDSGFGE
ncbi:MAG: HPr family phosphocarrier protein [Deltaproteobacteria bacterium]|nr:HPr family phosphocarrier protein [Deltaproteobacteria bacterium]